MRGLNLKEIMSKSNMNQQGLNIATYGQAYSNKQIPYIYQQHGEMWKCGSVVHELLTFTVGGSCITP